MMNQTNTKKTARKNDIYRLYEIVSYFNYVTYIFVGTLLFWIVNLPLLIGVWTIGSSVATLPIIFLLALPIGPAVTALFTSLIRVKETERMVRPFFQYYKENFKKSLIGWGSALTIMCLSLVNFLFLMNSPSFAIFKWLNLLVFVLLATFVINFSLVLANFEGLKLGEAFKLTIKLSIVKSVRYGLSFMIIIGSVFLFGVLPKYFAMVDIGIVSLLLLANFYPIKEEIDNRSKES